MVRYALLSVTDKSGLVPFARTLVNAGFRILSTGGTAATLRDAQIVAEDVEDYTGLPSIFDGRVKTLHPAIHGGILYDRERSADVTTHRERAYRSIDLVVVNLYNFAREALQNNLGPKEAVHHVDIGGPSMLRGAAKNWSSVGVVIDPQDYDAVGKAIEADQFFGAAGADFRLALSCKAFAATAQYDEMIASYLKEGKSSAQYRSTQYSLHTTGAGKDQGRSAETPYPDQVSLELKKVALLRYGENPHQSAAFYRHTSGSAYGLAGAKQHQGKELSYNNLLDLNAAYTLALDLMDLPAAVIVKHTNPCGAAIGLEGDKSRLAEVYNRALAGDPKSAFGSIVALTRTVDVQTAKAIGANFVECVAAPAYEPDALELLANKTNLRLLELEFSRPSGDQQWRSDSWRLTGPGL